MTVKDPTHGTTQGAATLEDDARDQVGVAVGESNDNVQPAPGVAPEGLTLDVPIGLGIAESGPDAQALQNLQMLHEANAAWRDGEHFEALSICQKIMQRDQSFRPAFVAAGEIALEMGLYPTAEKLLASAIVIDRQKPAAWRLRAEALAKMGDYAAALEMVDQALQLNPTEGSNWATKAMVLNEMGNSAGALEVCDQALATPDLGAVDQGGLRQTRAQILADVGRFAEAGADLKQAGTTVFPDGALIVTLIHARQKPEDFGETFESLVEKSNDTTLTALNRSGYLFAVALLQEQRGDYDAAFASLKEGNRLKFKPLEIKPTFLDPWAQASHARLTPDLFNKFAGIGHPSAAPIFIVGLPRTGSTLVEQILASHPRIAAGGEMPVMSRLLSDYRGIMTGQDPDPTAYLTALGADGLNKLGQIYLEAVSKRVGAFEFVTDKMLTNYNYAFFIKLIFPNAKIIHVMKNPLDSCMSCFRQLFARAHYYSYDMKQMAHQYRRYRDAMDAQAACMPGAILDVHYEALVTDTEAQVRRLLEYCGVAWDERCLAFHRTERQVVTASRGQVRQEMFSTALDRWKRYERHLADWKTDLAPWIDAYPRFGQDAPTA